LHYIGIKPPQRGSVCHLLGSRELNICQKASKKSLDEKSVRHGNFHVFFFVEMLKVNA